MKKVIYIYWMRKTSLIVLALLSTLAAKAQKTATSDTTIHDVCILKADSNRLISPDGPILYFDICPHYPGGDKAFRNFVKKNIAQSKIVYNRKCRILVRFVIEKDGTLSNIEFLGGIDSSYYEIVKPIIKTSPPWIPAKVNDETYRCKYAITL